MPVVPVPAPVAQPPAASGRSPWVAILIGIIVILVMVIGLGVAFHLGKNAQQPQPPPVAAPTPVDAAAPAPVDVRPPEVASPVGGPDAGQPAVAKPAEPKPVEAKPAQPKPEPKPVAEAPKPAAKATLDISVEPSVNVSIDGKPAGKTPLQAEVSVGTHKLVFSDPAQGINIVRNVKAKPGTNSIAFTIGRGSVAVNCPPGAQVSIDGRVVGTTPLKGPVPVTEGSHRIQVTKGGAKWQQVFEVGDGERMDFEVEISGD